MGDYTEIYVNTDFKENIPKEVIEVLKAMCEGEPISEIYPSRWSCLFSDMSYYTTLTCMSEFTYNSIAKHYSLIGKGDIKNYGEEIQAFFDFIKPWCATDFIGYHKFECDREPTLVYSGYRDE